MKIRERIYEDSELIRRVKDYIIKEYHLSEKRVVQKKDRLYITFGVRKLEDYTGIFYSEGGKRYFAFHLEDPMNNILSALRENLMTDNAVQKKGKIEEYRKVFRRVKVKESELSLESGKTVSTIVAITEIKKIPLGNRRHLSGNFLEYAFEYIIQPFFYTVEKHKSKQ